MCALGVSEPGNELVRTVDQNGPNATSLLAPSAAWSIATPETPRYTWLAPDAEPFASRSTFPQEAMATWPRTIQDVLSAGVASQRPRNVPFAGWRVLFWKMTNFNASGHKPNNVPGN